MNVYRVTFIGHRQIYGGYGMTEALKKLIFDLIREKEYVEFYVGRNGDFDIMAAAAVKSVQNDFRHDNNMLILALPYTVKDIEYYDKYYDDVIIPVDGNVHFKAAITKRNQYMIDNSQMLICYIERESGGAYAAYKRALEKGLKIINIAELV